MSKDFIPGPDNEFLEFANTFTAAAEDQAADLGIPADTITALKAKRTAFDTAYQTCQKPGKSRLDVAAKNEARKTLEHAIRHIKKAYIDPNEALSAAKREAFGLPPKDPVRSVIPPPDFAVGLTVKPREARQLEIERVVAESGETATPYGMDGAILYEKVGGEAPAAPEELNQSMILKRHKTIRVYSETERGKPVYYAGRWQNEKGEKGPWGNIVQAIIP
ncbi:MAG: hypothetical protein LBP20_05475 [Treponema sp.]|jgi:hypothetical protein|nr:hypothetical protein [Treponema sp.]